MRDLVGLAPRAEPPIPGTRVVVDVRPLQEPERMPITAAYLESLLAAFAASPLEGESFVPVLRTMRPDPTEELEARGLAVAARRRVPPTSRMFRSAGLTLDSFILRAAAARTAGHADDAGEGPVGAVYHTAGGAVPLGSSLPVVATVLDLAAWELPAIYAASPAARFGHRLRARILRDATRLIVCSNATAESARRRIHIKPERIAVVRLAAGEQFGHDAAPAWRLEGLRARFGIPQRYLVVAGPFDARKDVGTLFQALAALRHEAPVEAPAERRPRRVRRAPAGAATAQSAAAAGTGQAAAGALAATTVAVQGDADGTPAGGPGADSAKRAPADPPPWPPTIVLADTEEDPLAMAALARAADRAGVADLVVFAPALGPEDLAALEAGAHAFVFPSISEGTGIRVIEALAVGVPVLASRVGPLPELVGPAGILVEPRDAARFAAALRAIWGADHIHAQLARTALLRASGPRRSWADVARETRLVYAEAALAGRPAD